MAMKCGQGVNRDTPFHISGYTHTFSLALLCVQVMVVMGGDGDNDGSGDDGKGSGSGSSVTQAPVCVARIALLCCIIFLAVKGLLCNNQKFSICCFAITKRSACGAILLSKRPEGST